jgi:hypothetical protein
MLTEVQWSRWKTWPKTHLFSTIDIISTCVELFVFGRACAVVGRTDWLKAQGVRDAIPYTKILRANNIGYDDLHKLTDKRLVES